MKKVKTIAIVSAILIGGLYYYVTLPAINPHSSGFWFFVFAMLVILMAARKYVIASKSAIQMVDENGNPVRSMSIHSLETLLQHMLGKDKDLIYTILKWALIVLFGIYLIGSILSSPIINAGKYHALLHVEERNFTDDIKEVDFNTIPLLDKDSATILGDRKMGSMVDMVSQFEVSRDYTQINYQGKPVRVTPLRYASLIKWLTNQSKGIPAYILIDMASQNTECVKLSEEIRYSKSEHFNRNLYRHLRFRYPTYIFDDQIFFEIDENGTPYWVCPVKKFNIGLFGGQTVGAVVLCNAQSGECTEYNVEDVPQWVDKVYSAELLTGLYDYYGTLKNGFFNSVLGQKDCLQTTNGYNYIALDDDVWVYSGVTSVSGDQSNVGFVLMNQRTMETRYYKVEGAIEDSAMSSAEGQVQNLAYVATFPLLLNISDEPTYFMALKDAAGLVKKYAMVNVQKYQWVAIGDTIQECKASYNKLLKTNGITGGKQSEESETTGIIEAITSVVIEGNTHYYLYLRGDSSVYDVSLSEMDPGMIAIIRYRAGDGISLSYTGDEGLRVVTAFK